MQDMPAKNWRVKLEHFVSAPRFLKFVTAMILLNAVTLGIETSHDIMARIGPQIRLIDHLILGFFTVEIALKIIAYGGRFFKNGWNLFDFVIVLISLAPASGPFAILRTLRVLRVLRLVSVVPRLRRVITALLTAIPGMASVMGILLIIFYVTAVMTTQTFGSNPDPNMQKYFGDIGNSMFTLFQIMTLEGWHDIATDTLAIYPMAWMFFVSFITVASFAILNLFIGIIVDAMNILHESDTDSLAHTAHSEEMALLLEMKKEIEALRQDIEKRG